MPRIWVDADACPVKDEVYRVATRYDLEVTLVANAWMRTPDDTRIELRVVKGRFDAADDEIAERVSRQDIVVTADVPLAARCVKKEAIVLGPTGQLFTEENVGEALATRDLMTEMREAGVSTGGPPPLDKRDRSRFLQRLDEAVHLSRRASRDPGRSPR